MTKATIPPMPPATGTASVQVEKEPKAGEPRAGRKARETRERLVEGALQALCDDGVVGTTTRSIALKAGVPLGTLHYHFGTKEALLLAVLDTLSARFAHTLRMGVTGARDLDECIKRALLTGWAHAEDNRAIQIVQYELTLYALRTEGAEWMAKRQYNDYVSAHEHVFSAHAPNDIPATGEAIARLAQLVMAGIDGIIIQELAWPDLARSRAAVRALIRSMQALSRDLGLQ
ncbi:MAG: TetR/AcrR family transcriptional regulator [Parvibaculaceae bacterium]|nr:TetR/AcrR family transcriptional regulator [Parvibaculaceae bacterium]